ncbi:acyltransferase [Fulvivirga sp.]|uniref:acyltransferase n=1 Tax=Fulvivirga sp. TaxID=1931237 RepID=UPI0032F01368
MTLKKEFLNYIHLFRGLAIVVIVGIHCRISLPWSSNQQFSKAVFTTLLDSGTILFVFIAGFLFQYLKHKYEFFDYFKRKLKFVILPYLVVSVPILVYKYLTYSQPYEWMPNSLENQPYIIQCFYMILTGKHIGPFWFIPMIFIFYLISPLLLRLDNPKFYTYFFPFLFIAGLFTFRFGYYSTTIDSFIYFIPIYIFGMWGSAYRKQLTQTKVLYMVILFIIYIAISILEVVHIIEIPKLTSFESSNLLPYFHFNFAKVKVSLLCIILIRFFYLFNDNEISVLKKLADYSFGIFFLHMYIIQAIEIVIKTYFNNFELGLVSFVFYTLIVTIASMLLIDILKKLIGRNSRSFIGS